MEKFLVTCRVADFLFNSHLYHNAIDMYKEAQVLLKGSKVEHGSDPEILLHYKLALSYGCVNEFKEALDCYERLLKINEEVQNRDWEVKAYRGISKIHRFMGQHVQSIFFLRKLLQIVKETGDKRVEIEAYIVMGDSYYNLGKPDKFIDCYNDGLKICREIGDRQMEGQILDMLGSRHKDLAHYPEATRCPGKSLDLFKEMSKCKQEGYSYQALGMMYQEKCDFGEALKYHFKSLELMIKHGEEVGVGVSYNNIGTTYHAIGKYSEALEYFKKTHEIMKKFGNKVALGKAHHGLGMCYTSLGQFADAIKHQVKAVNILKETGRRFEMGRALAALGGSYNTIGHKKEAMNSYQEAIECSQAVGDRRVESNAYHGLGDVFVCLGNTEQGEMYLKKGLALTKETGDKSNEATIYAGLGFCYMCCGRQTESVENFNLGISLMQEIGDKRGEATALINLGYLHTTFGNLKKTRQFLKKALKITRKIGDKGKEHEALTLLGICNRREGELKKAHDCFSQSITCAEKNRELLQDEHKLSLDNVTFTSYYELCSLRISQKQFAEALCTVERGRARALADLLSKKYGIQRNNSHELFPNIVRELSIKNPSTILFMATHRFEKYFWVLEAGEIQFKLLESKVLKDATDLLTGLLRGQSVPECEDRSLSAYYGLKQSSHEKKDKRGQRLVEEEEEEDGKENTTLYQWYDNIFAPVADLVHRQDIIIIPEGEDFMVPFCALCDGNDKFLSETFRIRLIPSLTALRMIQDSPEDYHSATGALIVGNPSVPPQTKLSSLPGARGEALEIAELLGVSATVGDEATKKQVLRRIRDVRLIHIAANGDPERGEIALASSFPSRRSPRKDDFMLTMEDVAKVGTRAKLVVLSCCHSGKGQIMKSEGVVGISRAFLAAGARSVLVTLWAVDDTATKEFMIRFYGHLKRDKLNASEALHQTMKWMRDSKRYRFNEWAPFVLLGDDVTLDL